MYRKVPGGPAAKHHWHIVRSRQPERTIHRETLWPNQHRAANLVSYDLNPFQLDYRRATVDQLAAVVRSRGLGRPGNAEEQFKRVARLIVTNPSR